MVTDRSSPMSDCLNVGSDAKRVTVISGAALQSYERADHDQSCIAEDRLLG